MKHWSAHYVGLPPRGRDCWPVARAVYQGERGKVLPRESGGNGWRKIDPREMREFDLALFRQGSAEAHVGVIVRPWQMLHAPEGQPSVVEAFHNGSWLPKLDGIYRPEDAPPTLARPYVLAPGVSLVGRAFLNPDASPEVLGLPEGMSLAEMVRLLYPAVTPEQAAAILVTVSGERIDPERWETFVPRDGQLVVVAPQPGALTLGRLLSLIAVTAALAAGQFYVGPALAASLGFAAGSTGAAITTALTTAALGTAATLLINALIPAQKEREDSPSYAALGWENEPRPFQSVAAPAGRIRVAPAICARPYVYIGEDYKLHLVSLFCVGEGPLSMPIEDMRIGDTKLYKPAAEWSDPYEPVFNYGGVRIEVNPGTDADLPHTIYATQVVDTEQMGVDLSYSLIHGDPDPEQIEGEGNTGDAEAWVYRVAPRDSETLRVLLAFPAGLSTFDDSTGAIENASVYVDVEYRALGDTVWIDAGGFGEIRHQTDQAFFREHAWTPADRGDYEVRMRISAHEDFDNDHRDFERNKVQWFQLYGHRPEYPLNFQTPKATIAVEITGSLQLQGILKTFNLVASRLAPVYDPYAEEWSEEETRNPASFAKWITQGPANAKPRTDAQIIDDEFAELYQFCHERDLKYDSAGDVSRPFPELLSEVLAAGRAHFRYEGLRLGLYIDRPQSIVFGHVTRRNGFEIKTRRDRQERVDGWLTSFRDQTSDWEVKERRIPFYKPEGEWADPDVPEFVANPTRWVRLDQPGKTDPAEIYREGKRREFELTYRGREAYVSASLRWEGMTARRGQLWAVEDAKRPDTFAAYVRSVNGNESTVGAVIEIDDHYTMESGVSYEARFRQFPAEVSEDENSPPAQSVVRSILTVPGSTRVIALSDTGPLPEEGNLVIIGRAGAAGREMIAQRVESGDRDSAHLVLIPAAPIIDVRTDALVIPAWDGRIGDIPGADVEAPEILDARVELSSSVTAESSEITAISNMSSVFFTYARVDFTPVAGFSTQMRWRVAGGALEGTMSIPAGVGTVRSSGFLEWDEDYEVSMRVTGGVWGSWVPIPDASFRVSDQGGVDDILRISDENAFRRDA